MAPRVLVVDDDPQIREILRIALTRAGYGVAEAADGQRALAETRRLMPDLIVLDIGLPEMDGRALCREIRKVCEVPVVFLTAEGDEIDRVLGLELGADDYVTKPFSPRELVARIRAILKRTAPPDSPAQTRGVLLLDSARHKVSVEGRDVQLTGREMDLLTRLMERPEHVQTRPALVDAIWGTNIHVSDRTMDSHLRNLRTKLAEAGCPDAVETLHGIGIRMGPCRGA